MKLLELMIAFLSLCVIIVSVDKGYVVCNLGKIKLILQKLIKIMILQDNFEICGF